MSAIFRRIATLAWRRKTAALGGLILITLLLLAILAPLVSPYAPGQMRISQRLQPPSGIHWFGTDEFGRDLFARVAYGGRVSLAVGAFTVLLASIGGTLLGVAAGFMPRLDSALARVIDAMMAFPDILLAIALVAVIRPPSMVNVVIALGVVYVPRVARVLRAATQVIRETSYIEAARATGLTTPRILCRHVLRNLVSPLVVQGTFVFAYAILAEAGLSFLGLGPSPEVPTWGTIVASGQQFIGQADWIIVFPGLAIVLAVFALQMVGDAFRDALDPRLRKDV